MKNTPIDVLSPSLSAGEDLLWSGQPQQGLILRRSDGLFIPLGFLLGGGLTGLLGWLVYLLVMASAVPDMPSYFYTGVLGLMVLNLPFLIIGWYLLLGRFFFDRWRRSRTFYGLTGQRILIGSSMGKGWVRSIPFSRLKYLKLSCVGGGRCTLYFSQDYWLLWFVVGPCWFIPIWPNVERYQAPQFERIPDGQAVFELIKKCSNDQTGEKQG